MEEQPKKKDKKDKKDNKKSEPKIVPDPESWSEKTTLKCKMIGDRCGAFVWLLNRTAEYYENLDFHIGIGLIVSAYLLGAGGMPTLIVDIDAEIIKIFNGIIQGLMILLGTTKVIVLSLGFNKRVSKYRWASSAFSALFIDIQKTLGQTPDKREGFHTFYQRIQEKEFSLKRKTPYIPATVITSYYNILGPKALAMDILFGDVQEIEILVEGGKELSHAKPTINDVNIILSRAKSIRHQSYADDLIISKRDFKTPVSEQDLSAVIVETPDIRKAKKVSELRRYELERYFIGDD
jgi:hypothetical protein